MYSMQCPCAAKEGKKWRPCKGKADVFRPDVNKFVCGSHGRRWQEVHLWEDVKPKEQV